MARTHSTATRLVRLLEHAPEPIYVIDESRTIVFCNAACAAWTSTSAKDLLGRKVDYVAGAETSGSPGVAAGLCPPPATFQGQEMLGHVSCMSLDGRLLHRRARFVPLGRDAVESLGVMAFVESVDLDAATLATLEDEPSADELHVQIRRFRVAQGRHYGLAQLIGAAPALCRARQQAQVASETRANAVVVGPPGSGRSHVAHAIHYRGDGKPVGPLTPLSGPLVEADALRAAFDALADRDAANPRGTLLLTEADELAVPVQAFLAGLLGTKRRPPAIVATSRTRLLALADAGQFHRELAFALSTVEIELPSLAERRDDLPLLAQVFLEECNRVGGKQVGGIAPEALDLLARQAWPGNLDELRQVIAAAHQAAEGHQLQLRDLPERLHLADAAAEYPRRTEETIDLEQYMGKIETELITRAFERAKGNKTKAARLLGMTRPRLYRRLVQLGLAEETIDFEEEPPTEE